VEVALTGIAKEAETTGSRLALDDFDGIVREHQQRIYRVLFALLRNAEEANCLTQECFLRAFRKRASYRGEAGLGTWLTRIAINLVRDRARNRRLAFWKRRVAEADAPLETVGDSRRSPEEELMAREQLATVWSIVKELPDKRRTVFVLRYAIEMSLEEIAAAMNFKLGTVKSHLSLATQEVRRHLGRRL
jgi:RNA polymerase sigma-70 factor (ECF subfamily)